MSRKLWPFHGGIHVDNDYKALSNTTPVQPAPLPAELILPLQQHIGAPAKPIVAVGDQVLKGQMIAAADGFVSAPIHAPTSGVISAIEPRPIPHSSGLMGNAIVIRSDGADRWIERPTSSDYRSLDPAQLREQIRDAGIVGLGGAGFPSFIKLNPGARTAVDTLILNGAECEPWISCDDRLMREQPQAIIGGARIMRYALQARETLIAVEDNKPEAIAALRQALHDVDAAGELELVVIPTRYPTGGEKQLIQVLTGREVPSGGLPLDAGIVCHNVATAASVERAINHGEPLISRYLTITGPAVTKPGNWEVLIGTPMAELLRLAGGAEEGQLLQGGPMMGVVMPSRAVPVVKTSNCLLLLPPAPTTPPHPCIRCGRCAEVCPVKLLPQQLYWHARAKDFDKVQDYHLFDCIECGCCAYVCPSQLPLVHYYRFAKSAIWAQEREKRAADLARQRHDQQQQRRAREQAEKAARAAKKRAALAADSDDAAATAKKAAIAAALARAKAKRAAATPENTDNLTAAQQAAIDAVDARRRTAQPVTPPQDPT